MKKKVSKEKRLGEYLNPEQFLGLDEGICPFDDSVKVYNYLINSLGLPKDIRVYPVEVVFNTEDKYILTQNSEIDNGVTSYIFWSAINIKEQKVYTFVPAFMFDNFDDFLQKHTIENIILLEHDMYFVLRDTFYALIYTNTGESVIKKVNGVWSEPDVRSLISIKEPDLVVPDIYPVELFSLSEHKFICAAWAIEDGDSESILWYTVQWDDQDVLNEYDNNDLTDLPLNVGDVTAANNVKLEVMYSKEYGFYFSQTNKPLPEHILTNKYAMAVTRKNDDGEKDTKELCKTKILTLTPKSESTKETPSAKKTSDEVKIISMFSKSN